MKCNLGFANYAVFHPTDNNLLAYYVFGTNYVVVWSLSDEKEQQRFSDVNSNAGLSRPPASLNG